MKNANKDVVTIAAPGKKLPNRCPFTYMKNQSLVLDLRINLFNTLKLNRFRLEAGCSTS